MRNVKYLHCLRSSPCGPMFPLTSSDLRLAIERRGRVEFPNVLSACGRNSTEIRLKKAIRTDERIQGSSSEAPLQFADSTRGGHWKSVHPRDTFRAPSDGSMDLSRFPR